MSQYPPPPSFQRPFNPVQSDNTPSGAAQKVMPRFPYHPNPNSMPSIQYANPYPYNTTSQNLNGSLSVAGVPHPSYTGTGKATNGLFHPPPYPLVQSLYGILPQTSFAPVREPSLGSIQPHNSLPQKPPPVAAMAIDVSVQNHPTSTTNISELEDGEVSDEFGRDRREPVTIMAKAPQYSPNNDNGVFLKSIQSNGEGLAEYAGISRDDPENGNLKPKENEPSSFQNSDQNAPLNTNDSTKQPGKIDENSKVPLSARQSTTIKPISTSRSSPESISNREAANGIAVSREGFPQENTKRLVKLHDLAKDALKELHECGISFTQIANEGIDPKLLYDLYSELGIPISPNPVFGSKQATGIGRTSSGPEMIEPLRDINNTKRNESQSTATQTIDSLEKSQQQPDIQQVPIEPSNAPDLATLRNSLGVKDDVNGLETKSSENGNHRLEDSMVKNPKITLKPIQMTKPLKPPPINLLGKSTIIKPGDKALERKDYIARMLAAKSGKPISVASTTLPLQNSVDREATSQLPSSEKSRLLALAEGRCLQVGDLPAKTTSNDLTKLFSGFQIETVHMQAPSLTANPAGYAYAVLSSAVEARRAISELSGKHVLNHEVSVSLAPRPESTIQSTNAAVRSEDRPSAETVPDSTVKCDMDAEANKRAKTELARQKIEALKNRGNIAQSNNSINPNGLLTYLEPGGESQLKVSQEERDATTLPTPVPQQTSVRSIFMPVTRKPVFTIPGLFMESTALEPPTVLDRSEVELQTKEAQSMSAHTPASERRANDTTGLGKYFESLPVQSPMERDSGASYTSANPEPRIEPVTMNEPRRRQRAADFIDPPSVKARRPLGRNTDSSVIIEVSDNETIEDTENENMDIEDDIAMDIDEDNCQSSPPKKPSNIESGTGKQKAIRDLPPLSDFPIRKKTSVNVAVLTPPAVQTPTKIREQESLKTKVKEIELMNRRIAELEQRIKAKQTATRAETPGTPGRSGSPKHKSRAEAGDAEANNAANDQIEVRKLKDVAEAAKLDANAAAINVAETFKAAQAAEFAQQEREHERLIVEQRVKDLEKVKADGERLQAAEAAKAIEQERAFSEQSVKNLEKAKADAERLQAAEAARGIEQERVLSEQNLEKSKADAERLQTAEVARAIEQERVLDEQRIQDLDRAKVDAERLRAAEVANAAEMKRKLRLSEIESGLPVLDAEMEKNKRELHSLEEKIELLRSQVRKGEEWRRILLEERMELIPASTPLGADRESTEMIGNAKQVQLQTEERNGPSLPEQDIDLSKSQQQPDVRYNGNEDSQHSPRQSFPSEPSCENGKVQGDIKENQADLMDTSPDSPVGGGATDYGLGSLTSIRGDLVDTEEVYEPPEIPSHEPKASIRNSRMADSSDSDDYEPPEPASPVENSILPPVDAAADLVTSVIDSTATGDAISRSVFGRLVSVVKDSVTSDVADPVGADILSHPEFFSNPRVKKFTPYESPLKKFKSYRYHPEFLTEVPHGFRSMTYIHNIDPEKPVCRYELAGGVCNDDSCDGQHFRNMGLSDETVLLQMGSVPPDLSDKEAQAFRDGLRQLIHDIRERKVKDCSTVASEIAAYRAKFLGDKSKVLPL